MSLCVAGKESLPREHEELPGGVNSLCAKKPCCARCVYSEGVGALVFRGCWSLGVHKV